MSGELHNCHLHSQTDAEEGNPLFPCVLGCANLSFKRALAKAAGHQNPSAASQRCLQILLCQFLRVNPGNLHHGVVSGACVVQRLHHG